MKKYYSNGKLLLTGEYVVLDGAIALAIPTKFGQSLTVETIQEKKIIWKSINEKGDVWYESTFKLHYNEILKLVKNDNEISKRLIQILKAAKQLNPEFLNTKGGFKITTELSFSQNWGLGSSSTLINNIAKWASVDGFKLLELTFGGSGYDIACASHDTAITFQFKKPFDFLQDDKIKKVNIKAVNFNPNFLDQLFFVHLNQKQNSREGIKHYNLNKGNITQEIHDISSITSKMINCGTLVQFEVLMQEHEKIISKITKQKPVKSRLFDDYKFGCIKSLGAWGGDFVLATGTQENMSYFKDKGFNTIIPYQDMIL